MDMLDIISLGELLVDLLPVGHSQQGQPLYEANPGGAPANVASCAAKLGLQVGLIAKVGDDPFGHMLHEIIQRQQMRSQGMVFSPSHSTSLAVVHLSPDGDRSFSLYNQNPADLALCSDELPMELLRNCRIFHFGARSLVTSVAGEATLLATQTARASGAKISFDPNLRPGLWADEKGARTSALKGVEQADFIKLALEEMVFLYQRENIAQVLQMLAAQGKLAIVTDGANGCYAWDQGRLLHIPAYAVKTVDTTGAGDAFWAAFLYQQIVSDRHSLVEQLRFASAAGAIATLKKGSMASQPCLEQIHRLLELQD